MNDLEPEYCFGCSDVSPVYRVQSAEGIEIRCQLCDARLDFIWKEESEPTDNL